MNKTKIIATVGPASEDLDILEELIKEGMDVLRINLTHADYEFCLNIKNKLDILNKKLNTNVGLLLDTKGPELRVGKFKKGFAELKEDSYVLIYPTEVKGDNTKFSVNCPSIINDVKIGTIIKLDDGKIGLEVADIQKEYIACKVLNDGIIEDNKSLTIKGVRLNMPFFSEQDKKDVKMACDIKADFIALSFVTSTEDILEVNDLLIELGNDSLSVIAKIETELAVNEIDSIINASDGIMIARGDLGVQLPLERIPGIQKMIVNKCHMAGKFSIVATEMLASMENSSTPTRAEISDIANAVIDGTDAVLLSDETTVGKYPIESVKVLDSVIRETEKGINYLELTNQTMRSEESDITSLISYSVADCASRLHCKAIVVPTNSGDTAKKMSKFRPSCPIIAVSPNIDTVKNLSIYFGIKAILVSEQRSTDHIMQTAKEVVVKELELVEGDKIIITGGYPFKEIKYTNFMKIDEI